MSVDERMVHEIVQKVMANMQINSEVSGMHGVFNCMHKAIEASIEAQKKVRVMTLDQREKIISIIRKKVHENAEILANMGVNETGMGNVGDKILNHQLTAEKTPGTEDISTVAWSGDRGLTLVEMGPFGVIGAITPATNPSETVICNCIGMLAGGNTVVFNPHPNAKKTTIYTINMINEASLEAGGPDNIAVTVEEPTMESSSIMMKHPAIHLLVATGGPGVVTAVLSSGKRAIGAGAGNPPVLEDETADVRKAAKDIINGCTFDNNLPCIAEKEVFAFANIADELISEMLRNGAYKITKEQADKLADIVLVDSKNPKTGIVKKTVSRECVGRDAAVLLEKIGVKVGPEIRCIICETNFEHPFVQEELMMPILPIVRVDNIDEAIDLAVKAEHGNRHTAHMHSKNIDNLTRFARAVETTIFVKNAPSYAGIGFGGEGHTTFTIAGPTGEGLTSARSFTRYRRCVMTDYFRII